MSELTRLGRPFAKRKKVVAPSVVCFASHLRTMELETRVTSVNVGARWFDVRGGFGLPPAEFYILTDDARFSNTKL